MFVVALALGVVAAALGVVAPALGVVALGVGYVIFYMWVTLLYILYVDIVCVGTGGEGARVWKKENRDKKKRMQYKEHRERGAKEMDGEYNIQYLQNQVCSKGDANIIGGLWLTFRLRFNFSHHLVFWTLIL